jgi:hypothetical protein
MGLTLLTFMPRILASLMMSPDFPALSREEEVSGRGEERSSGGKRHENLLVNYLSMESCVYYHANNTNLLKRSFNGCSLS